MHSRSSLAASLQYASRRDLNASSSAVLGVRATLISGIGVIFAFTPISGRVAARTFSVGLALSDNISRCQLSDGFPPPPWNWTGWGSRRRRLYQTSDRWDNAPVLRGWIPGDAAG